MTTHGKDHTMTHPDSTNAFEADAARPSTTEVEQLRAQVAELKAAQKDTTPTTVEVLDTPANNPEVEAAHEVEVAGTTWHFHTPKSTALMAFAMGTTNLKNGALVMQSMYRFVSFHLVDGEYDTLMERMSDPEDTFGEEDFSAILEAMMEVGNASAEANAPKNGPITR